MSSPSAPDTHSGSRGLVTSQTQSRCEAALCFIDLADAERKM